MEKSKTASRGGTIRAVAFGMGRGGPVRGPGSNAGDVRLPSPSPSLHVLEDHCMATRTSKSRTVPGLTLSVGCTGTQ